MVAFSAILCAVLVSCALAAEVPFSYTDQANWPDICVNGNTMRQSPINIVPSQVQVNDDLIALGMNGWNTGYDGVFENLGSTLQFNPDTPGQATTVTHVGTYELQQFHMHWGAATGQGSEHLVNGTQAELEIHFVHFMQGATDSTAGDYAAVVGVLADVDPDAAIAGTVWEQLTPIQAFMGNMSLNFRYDLLLPNNLDYWYYEGSLTTPVCSEIVQWFVLQDRITVPGAYLDQLRTVQDTEGMPLTFNFRMPQSIGSRVVSVSGASPLRAVLMTSLLGAMLVLFQFY